MKNSGQPAERISEQIDPPARETAARRVGVYLLVAAVAAIVSLWQLGQTPLEEHECYVAVVAANMADPAKWLDQQVNVGQIPPNTAFNHWIVPVFNGQPRLVKTPMAYWCLAGLLKLGLPLNEFTARLPSAIEAVLLAVLTLALGRRMLPARAALLGTLVLTTSIGVFYWGRNGRPELLLCLLMTASMYCFYRALDTVRWSRHAWLFAGWIVMGAAHLAKEFVPVMVVAPLVMYAAWQHTQSNDEQRVRDESLGRLRWAMLALLGGTVVYCALLGVALHSEKLASQALAVNQSTSQPVNRIVPTSLTFAAIWKHVQLPTLAILFGGPVVWYVCQRGSWRRVLSLLPVSLPGAAIMVAMFLPWMLHVQHMFPHVESVLNTEVADRTAGAGRWQDDRPPGFYLFSLVGMVSPWVVLLPGVWRPG